MVCSEGLLYMGDPSVRKCSDSGSCAGRHCLPPRRKGRNGLCSSHPSLFPVFYLEATIELLFKGLSPALVPTPCYQLLSDYMNIKPVEASKTHFLSHCFTVLTLPFFFFCCFAIFLSPPTLKHVILLSDFLPNYEFQLLPRQSFRI